MFQSSPSYRPFRSARPNHFYFYFYLIFFFFFVARSVQGARRERNTDIFRPTGFVIPDKLGCPGKIGRSWIRKYNNKNKKKNKKKKKEKNKINIKPIIATAQQQPCPLQWLFFFVFLCCFLLFFVCCRVFHPGLHFVIVFPDKSRGFVCLAFISDYYVSFISDCRIDKQQSVSTIRLNFLDMMDTAEMEQKPVEKEKEFWRSERERDREKKKLGN